MNYLRILWRFIRHPSRTTHEILDVLEYRRWVIQESKKSNEQKAQEMRKIAWDLSKLNDGEIEEKK